jgi:transcriptional regulator with XRE-family HTH domain
VKLSKNELAIIFGKFIREVRVSKKISMEQLAHDAGISYMQLSRIEKGQINTTIYQLYSLLVTLKVPVIKIFKLLKEILLWNIRNQK